MAWGRIGRPVRAAIIVALAFVASSGQAAFVTPKIGGGEVGMVGAPMKHTDILFDGINITLHVDETVDTPVLRPLTPPNEFDPTQPWSVLIDTAYNFQNAWNPGGYITLPSGSGIWVERLYQDEGLEVYLRPPMFVSGAIYPAIFTQDGERWKWSGAMQHNVYTVQNPLQSLYTASYRVYIGDATTGEPLPGYGSADVTWTWTATPVPEPSSIALIAAAFVGLLFYGRRRLVAP